MLLIFYLVGLVAVVVLVFMRLVAHLVAEGIVAGGLVVLLEEDIVQGLAVAVIATQVLEELGLMTHLGVLGNLMIPLLTRQMLMHMH
ncbi:MAG: hypothetical protein Q8L07_11430 [Sediminibacterium sp.]|nr:hypothetical protein [Sediminibacterium sp.]